MQSRDEDGVRARIGEMAAPDPEGARFGADTHRYELAPALTEADIKAFEEIHGIHLPAEYRSFVAEVGNGPAGPDHGLMPLTVPRPKAGEEWAVGDEWEEDRLPGRLAEPFPLPSSASMSVPRVSSSAEAPIRPCRGSVFDGAKELRDGSSLAPARPTPLVFHTKNLEGDHPCSNAWAIRRSRLILIVAVLAVTLMGVVGAEAFGKLKGGGFDDPASPSTRAAEVIGDKFGGETNLVLLVRSPEGRIDTPASTETGGDLVADLKKDERLGNIISYWETNSPDLRSKDGREAMVLAHVRGDTTEQRGRTPSRSSTPTAAPTRTSSPSGPEAAPPWAPTCRIR